VQYHSLFPPLIQLIRLRLTAAFHAHVFMRKSTSFCLICLT